MGRSGGASGRPRVFVLGAGSRCRAPRIPGFPEDSGECGGSRGAPEDSGVRRIPGVPTISDVLRTLGGSGTWRQGCRRAPSRDRAGVSDGRATSEEPFVPSDMQDVPVCRRVCSCGVCIATLRRESVTRCRRPSGWPDRKNVHCGQRCTAVLASAPAPRQTRAGQSRTEGAPWNTCRWGAPESRSARCAWVR